MDILPKGSHVDYNVCKYNSDENDSGGNDHGKKEQEKISCKHANV